MHKAETEQPTRCRCISWPWVICLLATAALVVSLLVNVALLRRSVSEYRRAQKLGLDPAGVGRFDEANRKLPAPGQGEVRIVLFGDSRVAGWKPLPALSGAQLVNRGHGGDTTAQLLLRLDGDVLTLQPGIVVLQAGINDLKSIGVMETEADRITRLCSANFDEIIRRLRNRQVHVVVLTVFPAGPIEWSRRFIWSDRIVDAAEQVNAHLKEAAGLGVTVVDCDAFIADGQSMKKAYALDALHLNDAGYDALNESIGPVLQQLISAQTDSN